MPGGNHTPHNTEAEEALIGSVLINPGCIRLLSIAADDFFVHRHRWIWACLLDLTERNITPDFVTLTDELDKKGKLSEAGGPAYVSKLIARVPSSLNVQNYADIVSEYAHRRRLLDIANRMAIAAHDDGVDVGEATMQSVQQLTGAASVNGGAKPLSHFVSELYDDVEKRANNPQDIFGLSTGLHDFDMITGGLQQGESFYIGGKSGKGKSILSVQMGVGMASHGHPGAIYSLEMGGIMVTRRLVSSLAHMETRKLKTGRMDGEDWSLFAQACADAEQLPIFLSDNPYWTTAGLRADLARLKSVYGIKWFVLDYLYLMSDGMGKMKIVERTELLSSRVKQMCKEFDLAGVTVNSVTKEGDIRGSEQVKHDADVIVLMSDHIADNSTGYKEHGNMRTLLFKKGRELEQSNMYLHLVKHDLYPHFECFIPEPAGAVL